MTEFPWGQAITAVATLAGALGGAFLNHHFSTKKYRNEKIWEKRTESYSEIIYQMQKAQRCFESTLSYYEEDPHRAYQDARVRSHEEAAGEALAAASDKVRSSFLHLSADFVKSFEAFRTEMYSMEDADPHEQVDIAITTIKNALPSLERMARRDLKI